VRSSILMVSSDQVLSHTRFLLLHEWKPVVVPPEVAPEAIAASAFDLLIICQTVSDEIAAKLAEQMTGLHPGAKVMAVNRAGEIRNFRAIQFAVDVTNPTWLPDAVASVLSADAP
jgi:hypothetical protein